MSTPGLPRDGVGVMAELTPHLLDALSECARYNDRIGCYWWRKASMQKLEAMGLVETYPASTRRGYGTTKALAYRPTTAGRSALAEDRP